MNLLSFGVFPHILRTELSKTEFPSHWYHVVLEKPVTLFSCLTELSYILVFPQVTLPVYLNFTRADLIFTVDFEIATKEDPRSFYERGVAVLCTEWTNLFSLVSAVVSVSLLCSAHLYFCNQGRLADGFVSSWLERWWCSGKMIGRRDFFEGSLNEVFRGLLVDVIFDGLCYIK